MPEANIDELVVVHLKFNTGARSQRLIALSDIVAKSLYAFDTPVTIKKVRNQTSRLIGVTVDQQQILDGLVFLQSEKRLQGPSRDQHGNELWALSTSESLKIEKELKKAEEELEEVLDRHFPADISKGTLMNWFREVSAEFFGHYSTQWLAATNKGKRLEPPKNRQIAEFLKEPNIKYELATRSSDLESSYESFLSSDNVRDQSYLMSLGLAMYSAKLVAAGIGVDPITTDELKGATFVLDTNILLAIKLGDKRVKKSLKALDRAFTALGCNLVYTRPTQEEYERVIDWRRRAVITALENFSDEVLASADEDEFIQAIRNQGLTTKDEYDKFFNNIREMPSELDASIGISLIEDDVLEQVVDDSSREDVLKRILEVNRIKAYAQKQDSSYTPRPRSIDHDAAIICVARNLRLERKCWIISLDRALQATALEVSPKDKIPVVLSLEAIIEILAINGAGPQYKTTDFAPLLAKILVNRCTPSSATFNSWDLENLHNINEAASRLPKERVEKLLHQIHRAQLEGKAVDDARVQAKLNIAFNQEIKDYSAEMKDMQDRVHRAEVNAESRRKQKDRLFAAALGMKEKELKRKYVRSLLVSITPRLLVIIIIAVALVLGVRIAGRQDSLFDSLTLFATVIALYAWCMGPISLFRKRLDSISDSANGELLKIDTEENLV